MELMKRTSRRDRVKVYPNPQPLRLLSLFCSQAQRRLMRYGLHSEPITHTHTHTDTIAVYTGCPPGFLLQHSCPAPFVFSAWECFSSLWTAVEVKWTFTNGMLFFYCFVFFPYPKFPIHMTKTWLFVAFEHSIFIIIFFALCLILLLWFSGSLRWFRALSFCRSLNTNQQLMPSQAFLHTGLISP